MAERVLFVTDSDSNLNFATAFGAHLAQRALVSDVVLVADKAPQLVQAAAALGQPDAHIRVVASLTTLFADRGLLGYDVIFVLITGRLIRDFCVNLKLLALSAGEPKPITIGGFIGEWISGEAQVEERGALDLFVVNRPDEFRLFSAICAGAGHNGRLVELPYGFLIRHRFAKQLPRRFDYDLTTTILFADQVQVPRTDSKRVSLYKELEALAKASPERRILFCTREVAGGVTSHRAKSDITEHFTPEELAQVPNLVIERGTFRQRLAEAELVLSVSSTAGVEALVNGVPALFLKGHVNSGAEKFENTGLLIDFAELSLPKTFAPKSAFYDALTRTDVWDAFAALVREQPGRAASAVADEPVVPSTSVAPNAPPSRFEQLLRRTPEISAVRALPVAVPSAPLDLAASLAALNEAPSNYVARIVVSDAPRSAAPIPEPTIVATTISGYLASADIALHAREIALHFPCMLGPGDEVAVAMGQAGGATMRHDGDVAAFDAPDGIAASLASYCTASGAVSVIRLAGASEIEVASVTLSRPPGALPPSWFASEPRLAYSRLGVLAPTLSPGRVAIPSSAEGGRIVTLRFERYAVDREGPLFEFDDGGRSTLTVRARRDGALSLEFAADGDVFSAVTAATDAEIRLTILSASSRTVVNLNDWIQEFATPFRASGLRVAAAPGMGLSVSMFAAFGAEFSDDDQVAIAQRIAKSYQATATDAPSALPTAEAARVLGPYLDLVGASDLVAATTIVDGLRSPLAYAERYLRAGEAAKAFAISAICADRTPSSKAHLLICAKALAVLGEPSRAEPFLHRAEQLAPKDPKVKAAAAAIRSQKAGLLAPLTRLFRTRRRS